MLKVTLKQLPQSQVELSGEIPAEDFERFYPEVIKEFNEEMVIDGFRKGKAPENIVAAKAGEAKIMWEMAEHTLAEFYPKILEENKIEAIGRPEIEITKIARQNPLGFKIKTAIVPEVSLADYKKIAKTEMAQPEEPTEVEEKEIDQVIEEVRKARNRGQEELPEINDEFAQSLGEFKSLTDLRGKIRQNIELEKKGKAREKRRIKVMDEIIEKTKIDLPEVLIESEINKLEYETKGQIEQLGLKFDDYLGHLKKTMDDLHKEWRPEAEKRAKLGLILGKIAEKEDLKADPAEADKEASHLLSHYKDADPIRLRAYVENMMVNEKVFKFLEDQK